MVSMKDILASNAVIPESLSSQQQSFTAVFAGGTSGIGQLTIQSLVSTGIKSKIYIIGRPSAESRVQEFIKTSQSTNPNAKLVWLPGEISLLSSTQSIIKLIKSRDSHLDLLFLSAGYAPFGPRQETSEGLEIAGSLEYYSRMLFILSLLPLLSESNHARVISVLGGGLEKPSMILDDIDLREYKNQGGVKAQGQYIALNTLFLDRLATDNPKVTFIHSWPGIVSTGNVNRSWTPGSWMSWVSYLIFSPLLSVGGYFLDDGAAQRYLFLCTSQLYGGGGGVEWEGEQPENMKGEKGRGLFLVNHKNECTPNKKNLEALREMASVKVWEHTMQVLKPYL